MIYDCFTFFNELELLELRLNELDGVVDRFVLVESTTTFSGRPKELIFSKNRERFKAFADKIIHVVVDDMPAGDGPKDHWKREHFQRNAIARGLANCRPDDIILISDVDEIPHPETLAQFCSALPFHDDAVSRAFHALLNAPLTRYLMHRRTLRRVLRKHHPYVWKLQQVACCYYLNYRTRTVEWWYGTRLMHYRDFSVAEEMRYSGYKIVPRGGWHFTSMGDASRIAEKIASFAHQELNNPDSIAQILHHATPEGVAQDLARGTMELLPNEELPHFISKCPERFSSWLLDPAAVAGGSAQMA